MFTNFSANYGAILNVFISKNTLSRCCLIVTKSGEDTMDIEETHTFLVIYIHRFVRQSWNDFDKCLVKFEDIQLSTYSTFIKNLKGKIKRT